MHDLSAIRRKFDALALDQLRAEVVRLSAENDSLREQAAWWGRCADAEMELRERIAADEMIRRGQYEAAA